MRILRTGAVAALVYLCLGLAVEGGLALFQPRTQSSAVLRTFKSTGTYEDRVVSIFKANGQEWIASRHWFRRWYARIHYNQNVQIDRGRGFEAARAVSDSSVEALQAVSHLMKKRGAAGYWVCRAVNLFAPIKPVRLLPPTGPPQAIPPATPPQPSA